MPSVWQCPSKRVLKMAFLKFRMHVTYQRAGRRTWKQPIPVLFPTALDCVAMKRTGGNHKAQPGGNQNPYQNRRLLLWSNHRTSSPHPSSAHVVRSAHHWRFSSGPDDIVWSLCLLLFSGFPSRSILVFVVATVYEEHHPETILCFYIVAHWSNG